MPIKPKINNSSFSSNQARLKAELEFVPSEYVVPEPELWQNAIDKIRQIIKDYNLEYHVISEARRGKQKYIEFQISIKL